MVTRVVAGFYPHRIDQTFPAGPCEKGPCSGPTKEFLVGPGEVFGVIAEKGSPARCDIDHPEPLCRWVPATPHIVTSPRPPSGNCGDVVAYSCEAIMPNLVAQ